jgi:hypothetical protein
MTDTVPADGQHTDTGPSHVEAMQAEVAHQDAAQSAGSAAGAPPAGPPAHLTSTHPYPWPSPPPAAPYPSPVPLAPAPWPTAEATPVAGVQAYAHGLPVGAPVATPIPGPPPPLAAPPPTGLPPAGWYADPAAPETQRYWDGGGWVGPALPAGVPAPPSGTVPAEAATAQYPPGCIEVPLGDPDHPDGDEPVLVHVLPSERWPTSATKALNQGDFDGWAEECLAGDDIDLWYGLHNESGPTIGEAADMLEAFGRKTGSDTGKSRRQRRLSMRGRSR